MGRKAENLTGKKFNRWTVLKLDHIGESYNPYIRVWLCQCSCGNVVPVSSDRLKNGGSKRCFNCARTKVAEGQIKHGMYESSEYRTWVAFIQRCINPNSSSYHNYGGRGIKVCEEWRKFENFYADMGPRPKGLVLDRINNDGNYEPSNCRWTTQQENCLNKRNNA